MNWKEVTPYLYQNIKPRKGFLGSIVNASSVRRKKYSNLWIQFEMNSFIYNDPFYGEQSSNAPFNMEINLIDIPEVNELEQLHQLQGLKFENNPKDRIGAFSNSLHFTIPKMKFGEIANNLIPFEMEYCLTNSDSYGMMSGTIDEHLSITGSIKQDLEIKNLIVINNNGSEISEILNQLDKDIYNIKSIEEATDTNISYPDRTQYYIKYKNLIPPKKVKKKWWKL